MPEPKKIIPAQYWSQQSPIDLEADNSFFVRLPKSYLNLNYKDAPFLGSFQGEVGHENFVLAKPHDGKNPPTITVGDAEAELVKIHLHTPSEHDLEGVNLGGEIHLIHRITRPLTGSEFIVLGIFFNTSRSSKNLTFFKSWSKPGVSDGSDLTEIDPRELLPNTKKYFRYEGSLTSSPYSEIVSWLVFSEPLTVSSDDFDLIKDNAHQPERPVQPVNRRFVIRNFQS